MVLFLGGGSGGVLKVGPPHVFFGPAFSGRFDAWAGLGGLWDGSWIREVVSYAWVCAAGRDSYVGGQGEGFIDW